jgi:hypothetical protein
MRASLRILLGALLAVAVVGAAAAAESTSGLRPDHPDRYIVQRGDTLWDISERFLEEPWRWPDVWEANPQIENPHLIYPGDELYLTYRDGRPIIRARRGVVRLSPRVRAEPLDGGAIPTIPVDAIQQFLTRPRVVTEGEFDAAPYLLSVGREALMARPGEKVYARRLQATEGELYSIYRKGQAYVDPATGEHLGFEAIHVADAVVDRVGDPATLIITRMTREVVVGDRLAPAEEDEIYQGYMPRPPDGDMEGQIISVFDGVSQIGQYHVVVLNLGAREGLAPGHVFGVFQTELVEDPLAPDAVLVEYERRAREREERTEKDTAFAFVQGIGNAVEATADFIGRESHKFAAVATDPSSNYVALPEERAGTVMVFRSFERLSYGLVMKATRAMHVNDVVKNP